VCGGGNRALGVDGQPWQPACDQHAAGEREGRVPLGAAFTAQGFAAQVLGQPVVDAVAPLQPVVDAVTPLQLVVRRYRLNLIELQPERVIVHHWGRQGQADLRPFFKKHSLAKQGVEVCLIVRKREVITVQPGDDFLYGERLPQDFPPDLYRQKRQRRGQEEPDDGTAAPGSWSSFVWEGVEPGLIPWAVLKAVWRKDNSPLCPNCDRPTILVGFGRAQCGMFSWRARFIRLCPECGRQCEENVPPDLGRWLVAHVDRPLPGFQWVWGKVVNWQPPGDEAVKGALSE
jgi:hypothetical protein